MRIPATPTAFAAFFLGMIVVPAAGADRDTGAAPQVALQPEAASADVAVANCLLPGQLRSVGSITMVTPRRAVDLPANDCVARGGERIADSATAD